MDHLAGRCPESWTADRIFANIIGKAGGGPNDPIIIPGDLTVEGDLHITETLTVDGAVTLNGNVTIDANLHVTETLIVDGETTLNGDVTVDADLHVNETLVVDGLSTLQGLVTVNGNVQMSGSLSVTGALSTIQGATTVGGSLLTQHLAVDGTTTLGGDMIVNDDLTLTGVLTTTNLHVTDDLIVDGVTQLDGRLISFVTRIGGINYDAASVWAYVFPAFTISDTLNSEFVLRPQVISTSNPDAPDCPHILSMSVGSSLNRSIVTAYNATNWPLRIVCDNIGDNNFTQSMRVLSPTSIGNTVPPASGSLLWFPGQRCTFIRSQTVPHYWLPTIDGNWSFSYASNDQVLIYDPPGPISAYMCYQSVTFSTSPLLLNGLGDATTIAPQIMMHYVADVVVEGPLDTATLYEIDIPWPWLPTSGANAWPVYAQLPWIDVSPFPAVPAYPGVAVTTSHADGTVVGRTFGPASAGLARGVLTIYEHAGSAFDDLYHIELTCPVTMVCPAFIS